MKILIVDDDTFFQKFYSTQLIEKGYEVEVASNGIEGMEKLQSFKPDLLLLDIIMPQKDGFEVLQEKSNDAHLKNIPVIVFSTLGQEADIKKATELGANSYINKSFFDFDTLIAQIEQVSKQKGHPAASKPQVSANPEEKSPKETTQEHKKDTPDAATKPSDG